MKQIMCIMGTRPEIIKMEPVISSLRKRHQSSRVTLVHSGQHYDAEMSEYLLKELEYPTTHVNLRVGSGTQAVQTARMIVGYENAIRRLQPDLVLAQGDTNTVVAAGLAAIKLKVPFGHVEAGLRCYDRTMPEEINRTLADDCAQLCFAPTIRSAHNLLREGIPPDRIFITGNTIVDVCRTQIAKAREQSQILERLGLGERDSHVLVTAHRQENVDNPSRLERIVRALSKLKDLTIIYPVHPRTLDRLKRFKLLKTLLQNPHIKLIKPLSYLDFLRVLETSRIVLTDSGGVQEEALVLGVPCLTLRYSTERPETVEAGGNTLVGTDVQLIVKETRKRLTSQQRWVGRGSILGDGKAGVRIARICSTERRESLALQSPRYMRDGAPFYRLISIHKERKLSWINERFPTVIVSEVFDERGDPIFPEGSTRLRTRWHVQLFGQPCDITRLVPYLT